MKYTDFGENAWLADNQDCVFMRATDLCPNCVLMVVSQLAVDNSLINFAGRMLASKPRILRAFNMFKLWVAINMINYNRLRTRMHLRQALLQHVQRNAPSWGNGAAAVRARTVQLATEASKLMYMYSSARYHHA